MVPPEPEKDRMRGFFDRPLAEITVQWWGLKVASLSVALLAGVMIGGPVITAVERLSLDLEVIVHSAALPVARR